MNTNTERGAESLIAHYCHFHNLRSLQYPTTPVAYYPCRGPKCRVFMQPELASLLSRGQIVCKLGITVCCLNGAVDTVGSQQPCTALHCTRFSQDMLMSPRHRTF